MNTVTRQTATKEQLQDIENYLNIYMDTIRECLGAIDEIGSVVSEHIKMILGLGVKAGALGKFDSLNITENEVSFDAWIRVNFGDPGLYYRVKTTINIEEKRTKIVEY